MVDFIQSFGLLFLLVVAVSFLIKLFRQPIIIGYVLAGLIFNLYLVHGNFDSEQIILLSELGITFLLFLMGLEFDLKSLKYLGKDILISTSLQTLAFFGIGYLFGILFGFSPIMSTYLAIIFMFSSTLLVAKWLEDKKETITLHGKIALGTLIIQDLFAIIALTVLNVVKEKSIINILLVPVKGAVLILFGVLLARYILNRPLRFSSRYPELLFVFSLGICFLFVVISPLLGYSGTIGAFIAGVTLANTIYKSDILHRLKPLIIFFNLLFFVGLGFQIDVTLDRSFFFLMFLLVAVGLVVKPLIIYLTLKQRGYDLKSAYLSSIHLAQFSEFGIIIVAQGVFSGTVGGEMTSLAILAVVFSMIFSSYLIKYDTFFFSRCEHTLQIIDHLFSRTRKTYNTAIERGANILFFGYYDLSKELYAKFETMGKKVVVVENDPENIELLRKENIPYLYNSVSNPEFFAHFHCEEAELVVSSILDLEENKNIITHVKKLNPKAVLIVTAKNVRDSLALYDAAADYVIYPLSVNEQHVSVLLEDYATDVNKVIEKKIIEITRLKEREKKQKEVLEKTAFLDIDRFVEQTLLRDPIKMIKESLRRKK
ncbi:cation:proton antiporter [Candidatus Woesearchaeota archaeon]|nr:cation:proton antiporter [Candidatus Woesearchaeota archaeon]